MVAHFDSVTRSIEVPASPEAVWAVLTEGALLGECLGGLATIDPRPGGEVTFADDDEARVGAIDQLLEAERLSFIWYADERHPTEVTIDMLPTVGGTRVVVTERKFTWEFEAAVGREWSTAPFGPITAMTRRLAS